MATLRRINHLNISIPSGREEECYQFYERLLGLQRIYRPDEITGPGVWYRMGPEQEFHISFADDFNAPSGGNHFAVDVDDVAALMERLKAQGIEVMGPNQMKYDNSERVFCRDPFGNRIEFVYYHR